MMRKLDAIQIDDDSDSDDTTEKKNDVVVDPAFDAMNKNPGQLFEAWLQFKWYILRSSWMAL